MDKSNQCIEVVSPGSLFMPPTVKMSSSLSQAMTTLKTYIRHEIQPGQTVMSVPLFVILSATHYYRWPVDPIYGAAMLELQPLIKAFIDNWHYNEIMLHQRFFTATAGTWPRLYWLGLCALAIVTEVEMPNMPEALLVHCAWDNERLVVYYKQPQAPLPFIRQWTQTGELAGFANYLYATVQQKMRAGDPSSMQQPLFSTYQLTAPDPDVSGPDNLRAHHEADAVVHAGRPAHASLGTLVATHIDGQQWCPGGLIIPS